MVFLKELLRKDRVALGSGAQKEQGERDAFSEAQDRNREPGKAGELAPSR